MKRWMALTCLVTVVVLCSAQVYAQSGPVSADRAAVEIVGTLGGGALTGSLRLMASREVGALAVLVSDLVDETGVSVPRDPIPASAVTFVPGASWGQLAAGEAVQVAIQVTSPPEPGTWSGTLTVRWQRPSPGELQLPLTLTARNRPALSVVDPGQLKIAAIRGQQVTRTFLLQETANGLPTTGLRAVGQDLLRSEGDAVLPAGKVRVRLPATELDGGGWMTVSVALDLRGVPSGEYAGNLVIADDYYNAVNVPLEVSVKDRIWVPVAVLVLGVALGRGLSTYRSRGRPRDQLRLRIESVRDRVRQEDEFQEALFGAAERILIEAEADLAAGRWEEGNATAERAESLVVRWRRERPDWVAQVTRMQGLEERLEKVNAGAAAVRALKQRLERIDLGEYETARALRDEVGGIETSLARFERLSERLQTMDRVLSQEHLPPDVAQTWRGKLVDLQGRLDGLAADADADFQSLADEVVAEGREFKSVVDRCREMQQLKSALLGETRVNMQEAGSAAPSGSVASAADEVLRRAEREGDLDDAVAWAENAWRGNWCAQNILPLATGGDAPVTEAARAMQRWLSNGNNYLQPADAFRVALKELEDAVQEALETSGEVVKWPMEPSLPEGGRSKGILTDLRALDAEMESLSSLDVGTDNGGTGPPPEPPGCLGSLLNVALSSAEPTLSVDASRRRLGLFTIATYAVALCLLSWVGFNEMYASSATFGASGAADYFVLLAWGFGAEATQSAVADLVRGMVSSE